MTATFMSRGRPGTESSCGALVENIVDDLYRVDQTAFDGLDAIPRLPAIEAEADGVN